VLNSWFETQGNPPGETIPAGYGIWTSEDPNNSQWFVVQIVPPADLGPVPSQFVGLGIVENTNSNWVVEAAITNQAFGCYGPDGYGGVVVPATILADFGLSTTNC